MDILALVTRDRENLVEGLQRMQQEYEQLGTRIQQQAGAIQYADMLMARVKEEQNGGAAPVTSQEPEAAVAPRGIPQESPPEASEAGPPRRRR